MNPLLPLLLPWAILTGGQSLDVITTQHAFTRGCVEGNATVYGPSPSTARLLVTKSALVGGIAVGVIVLQKLHHPSAAKRIAYLTGGVGLGASVWNSRMCRP